MTSQPSARRSGKAKRERDADVEKVSYLVELPASRRGTAAAL
jgi:hypothetical protein